MQNMKSMGVKVVAKITVFEGSNGHDVKQNLYQKKGVASRHTCTRVKYESPIPIHLKAMAKVNVFAKNICPPNRVKKNI